MRRALYALVDRAPATARHPDAPEDTVRVQADFGDGVGSGASPREVRRAAIRADRRQAGSGAKHAHEALQVWQALVHGQCAVVDSFEADGRRFVLAKRFDDGTGDRRGLTPQECRVVARAAFGESRKATGYRLGLSRSRVSSLLCSAMRKLGVRTQAQLVLLMRGFRSPVRGDEEG